MTPFGLRLRELRRDKGVTQKEMARALGISAAYLSALEQGRKGKPGWDFVQRVIAYFNVIWDDADELRRLARVSHPRVVVDTAGLCPEATLFANLVAERISAIGRDDMAALIYELEMRSRKKP